MTDRGDHDCNAGETAASLLSTNSVKVAVADRQAHVEFEPEFLTSVTHSLLSDEGITDAEISIAIVDDAEIHELNRRYLDHDFPTDVISFLLSTEQEHDSPGGGRQMEGEIVISGETAARSAGEYGCPSVEELGLYLVHGLLHLCGYDDHTPSERERMRDREQVHLQKFGIEPHY